MGPGFVTLPYRGTGGEPDSALIRYIFSTGAVDAEYAGPSPRRVTDLAGMQWFGGRALGVAATCGPQPSGTGGCPDGGAPVRVVGTVTAF